MTGYNLFKTKEKCNFLFCGVLLLLLFAFHLNPAKASEKKGGDEILAIGSSAIVKDNLARAKEKALSQALGKGIEGYLLRRLGNEGMVNNFQRIVTEIIPNAKEAIENYHILAEDQTENDYKILVRLGINKKVINNKLRRAGLVIMQGPAIKALFLISEKKDEETVYWWKDPESPSAMSSIELALYNSFQERGFIPVNRRSGIMQVEFPEGQKSLGLTKEAILKWGRLFSADVVIRGKAEIIQDVEISLMLKAIDVSRNTLICQAMHIEPIPKDPEGNRQAPEAIKRLVNHLTAKLAPIIIQTAASQRKKARILDVTITGLKTYRQFMEFSDFLVKNVKGVKSLKQTRTRKDSISIEVKFEGDEKKFIERILRHESLPFLLDYSLTEEGNILIEVK